jgi:hypothetical protein
VKEEETKPPKVEKKIENSALQNVQWARDRV